MQACVLALDIGVIPIVDIPDILDIDYLPERSIGRYASVKKIRFFIFNTRLIPICSVNPQVSNMILP